MPSGKPVTLRNKPSPGCQGRRRFISRPAKLGGAQLKGAGAAEPGQGCWQWQGEDSIVPMSLLGQSPAPGLPLKVQEPCCLCCASLSVAWQLFLQAGVGDPAQGWSWPCSWLCCSRGAAPPSLAATFAPPPSFSSSPGVKLSRGVLPSPAFSCPLPAPCSLQLTSSRASPDVLSSSPEDPSAGPSPLLGAPRCGAPFG